LERQGIPSRGKGGEARYITEGKDERQDTYQWEKKERHYT
jgi:hypothetical protein